MKQTPLIMQIHKKAFTLLEIMIVIMIFGVGILSTLILLGNNVSLLQHTKTEQQASMLAYEGIQLFLHNRDNNLLQGYPWNYFGLDTNTQQELFFGQDLHTFKIGYSGVIEGFDLQKGELIDFSDFDDIFDHYQLYLFSGQDSINRFSRYTHTDNHTPQTSPITYARYLTLTGILEDNKLLPKDKILKLESHVLYKKGIGKTGEVVLETFIGNKGF